MARGRWGGDFADGGLHCNSAVPRLEPPYCPVVGDVDNDRRVLVDNGTDCAVGGRLVLAGGWTTPSHGCAGVYSAWVPRCWFQGEGRGAKASHAGLARDLVFLLRTKVWISFVSSGPSSASTRTTRNTYVYPM